MAPMRFLEQRRPAVEPLPQCLRHRFYDRRSRGRPYARSGDDIDARVWPLSQNAGGDIGGGQARSEEHDPAIPLDLSQTHGIPWIDEEARIDRQISRERRRRARPFVAGRDDGEIADQRFAVLQTHMKLLSILREAHGA